ncbi:protein fem-1 homolog B isoform X2 [Ischnura elegans]|uniref:protein fem-1 homolog B isoform X2 n=1 Tax=Ischnura elegans TaxID=197161 RepID=UPI001ED8A725|nr:protein fem-1 homolog B isoform X2 [Ischnura elegans]
MMLRLIRKLIRRSKTVKLNKIREENIIGLKLTFTGDVNQQETEQYLKRKAFFAAKDGLALTLHCVLIELRKFQSDGSGRNYVKECVDELFEDDGQKCTPLIIASRRGHYEVVQTLLTFFNPDVEKEGTVKFDGFVVEGACALWCAAGSGHLSVVKALVEAGANVNHPTTTESTPLRAACFDGRLEIVQYLVEKSADIHLANRYNNTCLMISAYKGHLKVVKYLLSVGVDPDERAHCGATALHFAAECGEDHVVRALVEDGGAQLGAKNGIGMTPLMVAAERTRASVVEYLLTRKEVSREERIDAMELLGASYANDKDNYCPELAFHYLRCTMELRFPSTGESPIPKPQCVPIPAYENRIECQNMEELDAIRFDHNALHMESLCIRERILGQANPEVTTHVVFRGAVFADTARFDRCIDLWMHALHLRQMNDVPIVKDLLRFAQVFSQMIHLELPPSLPYVEEVLRSAIEELKKNKANLLCPGPKSDPELILDDLESNLVTVLYILLIITKLIREYNGGNAVSPVQSHDDIEFRVYRLVFQLNKLQLKMGDGKTLLHMAVDPDVLVDDFHTNDICRFPSSEVAMLLIRCGADINAMDRERNTPLHIVARDYATLDAIILALIDAGAHIDTVNNEGKTPLEMASTSEAKSILRSHTNLSLKCMAAKAVNGRVLKNQSSLEVPKALRTFIELHSVNARKELNWGCEGQ